MLKRSVRGRACTRKNAVIRARQLYTGSTQIRLVKVYRNNVLRYYEKSIISDIFGLYLIYNCII